MHRRRRTRRRRIREAERRGRTLDVGRRYDYGALVHVLEVGRVQSDQHVVGDGAAVADQQAARSAHVRRGALRSGDGDGGGSGSGSAGAKLRRWRDDALHFAQTAAGAPLFREAPLFGTVRAGQRSQRL